MKYNTISVLLLAVSTFFCAGLAADSLQIANLTDRPVYFGIYFDQKGSAIKYAEYSTPQELPAQQNAQTPLFTTAKLPGRICSEWGLAGKGADCRDRYGRLAIFSFSKDDIVAGHQLRSIAGDPSLNTANDFQNKGSYYIFMNQHGFDPVYATTGEKKMDKRDLKQGKLNMVSAKEPRILESLKTYLEFAQGKR